MSNRMSKYVEYMQEHLAPTVGQRITNVVVDDINDPYEPVLGLKLEDGSTIWCLRDPEGNGPGHLELQGPR